MRSSELGSSEGSESKSSRLDGHGASDFHIRLTGWVDLFWHFLAFIPIRGSFLLSQWSAIAIVIRSDNDTLAGLAGHVP